MNDYIEKFIKDWHQLPLDMKVEFKGFRASPTDNSCSTCGKSFDCTLIYVHEDEEKHLYLDEEDTVKFLNGYNE